MQFLVATLIGAIFNLSLVTTALVISASPAQAQKCTTYKCCMRVCQERGGSNCKRYCDANR